MLFRFRDFYSAHIQTLKPKHLSLLPSRGLTSVIFILLLSGCTTAYHHEKADKEMYEILRQKEKEVFGQEMGWRIETEYSDRDPNEIPGEEIVGQRTEEGEIQLDLTSAFAMAVQNSREFQTRRENLYLAALEFSRQRHQFSPRFFGSAEVSAERTPDGERHGRVSGQAGVSQLLQTGGSIGLAVTSDIVRFLTRDPRRSPATIMSVDLVQPLLRGAGREVVAENLTQAEREVIYEIRTFSQFQQAFAVRIVSSYLRLLQQQDAVRNEFNTYENLVRGRERAEALARDRLSELQADQARQDELRARSRYIFAVEAYLNSLDQFKLDLSIPPGYEVALDDQPLRDLETVGLIPVPFTEGEAMEIALAARLDLLNEIDRFEDAKRQIAVTANFLKPGLNLFGGVSLQSDPDDYTRFDLNNYRADVGLALDLPLDRRIERNAYRQSLISFERQLRTLGLAIDALRSDIREGLRGLSQAEQNYAIQRRAVELADRRLDAAQLLWEAGRAEIRDILEAEAAQLQARNALTRALIDYHTGRYTFMRDLGILETDEEGLWIRDDLTSPRGESIQITPDRSLHLEEAVITPDELFLH